MTRLRPALLAALLATGCIPDTAKLDPFRSASTFCPVLFDLVIAKFGECRGIAPYLAEVLYAGSAESCAWVTASEKAGRLGFDRASFQPCLDALKAPGCAAFQGSACDSSPFVPKVQAGGHCVNDLECVASTAGCYNPDQACATSRCMNLGGAGARCLGGGIDPSCNDSNWCDYNSGPNPVCVARLAAGQPCGSSAHCQTGTYCGLVLATYQCTPQRSRGAACTPGSDECLAPSLYCDSASSKCELVRTDASVGDSCAYPNRCADGLWSDFSGATCICRARSQAVGAPCTSSSACGAPGTRCISSTCQYLAAEGASCTPGLDQCQDGLYCASGSSSRCARWPAQAGATCGTVSGEFISCGSGLYCNRPGGTPTGTCAPTVAPGAPCPTYDECGSDGFSFVRTQCQTPPGSTVQVCVAPCPP